MENPIKMDDLGVPLFLETPKFVSRERESSLFQYETQFVPLFLCRDYKLNLRDYGTIMKAVFQGEADIFWSNASEMVLTRITIHGYGTFCGIGMAMFYRGTTTCNNLL